MNELEKKVKKSFIRRAFPEVHHNDGQPLRQMKRIKDEYLELVDASEDKNNRKEILNEGIDVLHSCMNTLYKFGFTDREIYKAIINVRNHNAERGYYKDISRR